jgi:ribose 1,5-bisphosphate isomerase
MTYEEIVQKIKSLEIQGAQNIAIKGVEAFGLKMKETSDKALLQKYADEIIATRSTEPGMRNGINFCLGNVGVIENPAEVAIKHFQESNRAIAEIGAKKIKDGMIVFTHCHSSTVEAIILKALEEGKKFEVYNTETRPKFQGRITATELAKAGIKITHMVDSAGRSMIKKADLFLFGCDAITSEGFLINKIGTESLVDAANEAGIPSYSCTDSWKFDTATIGGFEEAIEQRDPNEVWENPPENVTIYNPAFEITRPDKFTGVITEIGVYKAETLVLEFQKHYPYLFKK